MESNAIIIGLRLYGKSDFISRHDFFLWSFLLLCSFFYVVYLRPSKLLWFFFEIRTGIDSWSNGKISADFLTGRWYNRIQIRGLYAIHEVIVVQIWYEISGKYISWPSHTSYGEGSLFHSIQQRTTGCAMFLCGWWWGDAWGYWPPSSGWQPFCFRWKFHDSNILYLTSLFASCITTFLLLR